MEVSERELERRRIEEVHLSTQQKGQVDNDGRRRMIDGSHTFSTWASVLPTRLFLPLFLRYFEKKN